MGTVNSLLRGWGEYYKRAHVRRLFNRLDRWIVRRIWSHRFRRWRNGGWKQLPEATLYREYGLVNLIRFIPSLRISAWLSLRESCIRENRTCSLSGGRRPARKRASSDPTPMKPGNCGEGKEPQLKADARSDEGKGDWR